ncbi:MAG: DUF1648 domain-containing protein [Chloroflexi bacterium]|nr:DUF1648 domain-containing protein [Chloroflexota bacterium]
MRRSAGGDAAIWVAGALLFVAVAVLVLGGSREPGLGMLLMCVLAAVLAAIGSVLLVLAIGYQRLAYCLVEAGLRIDWLGRTLLVPYAAIQGIYSGQRLAGHALPRAVRWPGISVGSSRARSLGRLRFYATSTDQSQLIFVSLEHGGVIISARDPQGFRAALIERVEQTQSAAVGPEMWVQSAAHKAPWTAIHDPWLPACAVIGTLVLLIIVAVITFRFDALPDQLAVHFDVTGRPNQIASKFDLLRLPLFGLFQMAVNWVLGMWLHPRQRLLARLLWVGGAVLQVVLLVGVLRLVE